MNRQRHDTVQGHMTKLSLDKNEWDTEANVTRLLERTLADFDRI